MTTNKRTTYLNPEEVRTWVRERLNGDAELQEMVNSGSWGKISRAYHRITDEAIEYFRAHLGEVIGEQHFARIVLDHIDPHRNSIGRPHGPETEWPPFDPDKFDR